MAEDKYYYLDDEGIAFIKDEKDGIYKMEVLHQLKEISRSLQHIALSMPKKK